MAAHSSTSFEGESEGGSGERGLRKTEWAGKASWRETERKERCWLRGEGQERCLGGAKSQCEFSRLEELKATPFRTSSPHYKGQCEEPGWSRNVCAELCRKDSGKSRMDKETD
jgi:hypothetical protein